jgi:DNA repair exonuclease SbcCD ATPase subunit
MMGLGVYDKTSSDVQKQIRSLKKEIQGLDESKIKFEAVRDHLPSKDDLDRAFSALEALTADGNQAEEGEIVKAILEKILDSLQVVEKELASPEMAEMPEQLKEESKIAKHLKEILANIPDVAEGQLRPHVRNEARLIFRELFGDKYSDLAIDDDYEVKLYNLQGHEVPLMAASGGEDVCVNFALRVAVNTALQKHSIAGPPPGLIILDEPGAGLDEQRRRWLPDAIKNLDVVDQVIVVTHMQELKGTTDHIITLTPQGKGRQPLLETQ